VSELTKIIEAELDAAMPYLCELGMLWKKMWRIEHPNSFCNDGVTSPSVMINYHFNEIRRLLREHDRN
jgi:hypothetical protein